MVAHGELSIGDLPGYLGVLNRVLYCVGGYSNTGQVKTVERYNEDTNTWSLVAEMNHSRDYPGVLSHQGRLYVVGGHDGHTELTSVEMYDPKANTWTLVSSMSVGRQGLAVALIYRPNMKEGCMDTAHSAPLDSKMNIVPVNSWELIFVALKICGAVIIIFVSYYTINNCF